MGTWVGGHWRGLAGAGALVLPVWQGLRSLLSVVSDVDFVVSKASEPGWIGSLLATVQSWPSYIYLLLLGLGLALIWLDLRGRAQLSSAELPRIADRTTADAFLKQFANNNGLKGPMQGSGERIFDRYVASYNDRGGSLALAIRQDKTGSAPYFYVDQNDQERAARYDGREYTAAEAARATNDFNLRRKNAYSLRQRSPTKKGGENG